MTTVTFIKETFNWVAYSSEVLSIIIMVGHGRKQTDMVLEKELRVLHLDPKGTGSGLVHGAWLEDMRHQSLTPQWHTFSNKATPPNSATPYEPVRTNYIQATTYVYVCV